MGHLTLALRENSHRLGFLGYDAHGLGVSAFAISAMLSGIAGSLQALNNEAVNYVVFDAGISATVVLNSYIGGVGTFLGPALGAALMTFFSYAVSDATQSWLLYQGILFVLVMMVLPGGLTGLVSSTARLIERRGVVAVLPPVLLTCAAALLLSAGTVFIVEALQRLFSQDYRSLARMAASLPSIPMFGHAWPPAAATTWLVPVALFAAGTAVAWSARTRLIGLELASVPASVPARP
jgi:branched-chain amino acid transport system permease protein